MGFGQQMQLAQLGDRRQDNLFGQGMQLAGLGDQRQNNLFDQGMQLQGTQFGQGLTNANLHNQRQQQIFDNAFRTAGMQNQQQNALFNQRMGVRNQGLQELMMQRNQPYQDLSRMLGLAGPPPGMPQFMPTPQWGAQAPNYAGMMGNFLNAGTQSNNAWMGLLGQLGGAAINRWGQGQGGQA